MSFIFNFLFHNSKDKFDRQIVVANQINHEENTDVLLGPKKEFVITESQTHGPGHGTVYCCSEPSVILLSYPCDPKNYSKLLI